MFRIECFCDDKSLADLLKGLARPGVYNVSAVPVTGAKAEKGSLKGDGQSSREGVVMALAQARRKFTKKDTIEALVSAGYAKNSSSQILHYLLKRKRIRRTGVGVYEVTK